MAKIRRQLDVSNSTTEQKNTILQYAAEAQEFEIERFWKRSLFFWGFIGAAFVAYAQLLGKGSLPFLVGCFGTVCAVAWTLENRGSKYWQEAWESKVKSVERDVLGTNLFSNREPVLSKGIWGATDFSVTKLATVLSDFTVVIWLALTAKGFPVNCPWSDFWQASAASVVTLLFIGLLCFNCRQSGPH